MLEADIENKQLAAIEGRVAVSHVTPPMASVGEQSTENTQQLLAIFH